MVIRTGVGFSSSFFGCRRNIAKRALEANSFSPLRRKSRNANAQTFGSTPSLSRHRSYTKKSDTKKLENSPTTQKHAGGSFTKSGSSDFECMIKQLTNLLQRNGSAGPDLEPFRPILVSHCGPGMRGNTGRTGRLVGIGSGTAVKIGIGPGALHINGLAHGSPSNRAQPGNRLSSA